MIDPAFEIEDASEILIAIGELILGDSEYHDTPWNAFTLVVDLDRGRSMYGYAYADDGLWQAARPGGIDVLNRAVDLRAAMSEPGKRDWKLCVIQVSRSDEEITIDFEYKSTKRWKVTPANVYDMAEKLRPQLSATPDSTQPQPSGRWWRRRRL
ncbi:hypothetical protein ABZ319_03930 [Nocardia sp. NPDC005978]|uniref:hypothetical protein n=1 Tax=Nocardia sp. NPDC005978 TaxID=3156725 RepID=UPI0033A79143